MTRRTKQILSGAGRLFDFSGSYTRNAYDACIAKRRFNPQRSDVDALNSDMRAVGGDFARATEKVANEEGKEKQR
jgi:hypothetical protein